MRNLPSCMEERALTEQLIGYDTSTREGINRCSGFVKGWLEARDIEARADRRSATCR